MNTPPRQTHKYRRPLPSEPNPRYSGTPKKNAHTPPPPASLKRKIRGLPDGGRNPIIPVRASMVVPKDNKDEDIMSSLHNDTIQSTHKQRSKQKKNKAMQPPPSDYHLTLAAAQSKDTRDPRLANMPPAAMGAREVDSNMEYKAFEGKGKTPKRGGGERIISPNTKFGDAPKIPGPAKRPKGKGYEHQRRDPPQYSTQPNPFVNSNSVDDGSSMMMMSNPTSISGQVQHQNIRGGKVPQPKWPMNTPPRKIPSFTDSSSTPNANTQLGPKSKGQSGRKLFKGEVNRMEQEKEKARLLKEIGEEEKRKEAARKKKEEEEQLRIMREKVGGQKVRPIPADENDDIFSTDSSTRSYSIDQSSLNFGMDTAKRFFGTNGTNTGKGGVKHYRKGFKPPPPPGRPKQKPMSKPNMTKAPTGGDQRPPAEILNGRRGKDQKAVEMLNQGWWRFTDPDTQWQYFWNEVTNISQYERPLEFETVRGDVFSTARSKAGGGGGVDVNSGWKRFTDEDTKMHYFYKESTDEGQWERPIGFDTMRGGFTAAQLTERREDGQLPVECSGEVVKYVDPVTGFAYYYDEVNNTSSYDRPKGYTTSADPFASIREGGGWRMIPAENFAKNKDEDQLPVEKLGGTWGKYVDKDSGYTYYWNEETGESTFDRPDGFQTNTNPFGNMREGQSPASILASTRSEKQKPEENLNGGWKKYTDPATNAVYYYNEQTDESTYGRPTGFSTRANPFGTARKAAGMGTARSTMGTARSAAEMGLPPAGVLSVRRDEDQLPVEKLNGGWQKFVDPESGHPYYYHEGTDESSYDRPEGFKTSADAFIEARKEGVMPTAETLSSVRSEKEMPHERVNGGWCKYEDPSSGHPYWYNEFTEESTYERPADFSTNAKPFGTARSGGKGTARLAMGTASSAAEMGLPPAGVLSVRRDEEQLPVEKLNGGWQKFMDPESGHPYYYNKAEDESTFDRPDDFATNADAFSSVRNQGVMPAAEVLSSARSAKQKPVEKLNGGWQKFTDPESDHPYYFNEEIQESTYERPSSFVQTVADLFAEAREEGIMPAAEVLSSARSAKQKPDETFNGGWQKFTDLESGHPYYWNETTDESTYERPEGFQTNANPFASARGSIRQTLLPASVLTSRRSSTEVGERLNGGWVKYIDPESGWPYYYHAENDVSQYEKPDNFVTSYNPFGTVKSRRRTGGSMLPNMSENAPLGDDIMTTGGSSMDALDNAMMATFNRGSLNALSENSPLKSKASVSVPLLSLGGGGGRKSSIGRSGKTVLASANDVLTNVNAKLASMSVDEMKGAHEGEGLMSTLRKNIATGRSSGKNTNRDGVVIPQLSLGGVGGSVDSLDFALAQAGGAESQSWDAIADEQESATTFSSVLAGDMEETTADFEDAANAWEEYFDEEVGAKYYFNSVTEEASWVNPNM